MTPSLATTLGPLELRSPFVAASGTVGSVVDAARVIEFDRYGAAVAKSVAATEWPGNRPPRMGPTEAGMLNGIGIPNPGVAEWVAMVGPALAELPVPVWGSAVGGTVEEFAMVAQQLAATAVTAIELNLSCPNLRHGSIWSFDAVLSGEVVTAVRSVTDKPIGAKLSPNTEQVGAVAEAVLDAGADWLVLTNTALGAGIDIETRRPTLSIGVGGYSGVGIKPLALRCVMEVTRRLGPVPIVGTGGIRTASDVIEYLLAGASAVGLGTVHFERPNAARRIERDLVRWMRRHDVADLSSLVGSVEPW